MSKLYSSRQILAALERAGFERESQRGSHVKLRRKMQDRVWTVIVKHPASEVPAGTFSSIIKQSGLSRRNLESLM